MIRRLPLFVILLSSCQNDTEGKKERVIYESSEVIPVEVLREDVSAANDSEQSQP